MSVNELGYVPVLRAKQAELDALAELFKHQTKTFQLTPLIELIPK